jgi:hypothetical protein
MARDGRMAFEFIVRGALVLRAARSWDNVPSTTCGRAVSRRTRRARFGTVKPTAGLIVTATRGVHCD